VARDLPIWKVADDIVRHLTGNNRLVLVAPTGSGKSTQVPQLLADSALATGKRIVVLQPRRVAARTLAARVAWERGGKLGGEVGYQVRFEDRIGDATRICFITEGILLRWMQDDPALSDIGVIVFDEFHERNLLSDVALALAKQRQAASRPDLKLVVMSATLDAEPVADYLAFDGTHCPIVVSEGQMFPVQITHSFVPDETPIPQQAARVVAELIDSGEAGDVLVFMPGMGEIQATINALRAERLDERLALFPLHGELSPQDQDLAFEPNPLRKVVVATNVAETSVTIDGVRHVVDSGLARVARYDSNRGLQTLLIEEISRASADQRKGRAGRTGPGTCRRLWTESNHLNRPERNTPEIRRADLAETVLLLHSLGVPDATTFDWLDKPEPQAVARAERLLRTLGAIDPVTNHLTAVGRKMLRLPMHPRFSRMLVEAQRFGCVEQAALCAALVSGRDLLTRVSRDEKHIADARETFEGSPLSDFFTLLHAYQHARNQRFDFESCRRYGINAKVAREVDQTFQQLLGLAEREGLGRRPGFQPGKSADTQPITGQDARPTENDEGLLRSLFTGFADQLCQRLSSGTLDVQLTEGRTAALVRESVVQSPLFVAAMLKEVQNRSGGTTTLVGLATAVKREWIEDSFPEQLQGAVRHEYDRTHRRVAAIRQVQFHGLTLARDHQKELDPAACGRALAEAFAQGAFDLPNLTHEVKQLIARTNFVATAAPELEFPKLADAGLVEFFAQAFHGLSLAKEAQAADLKTAFLKFLGKDRREWLDALAPVSIPWPSGKPVKLAYAPTGTDEDGILQPPEAQVKLLECFDLTEHPKLVEGTVPVRLALTTPDGKRLDATTDWPSFKSLTYPKLRAGLAKKFPGFTWR
jgi:ATP-dependent helicase HrpB